MDVKKILTEATACLGPSGQEMQVAEYFADAFRPFVDEVYVDDLFNVVAHIKGSGPRIMLAAHMDEICMMVIGIEDDGCIRMGNVGGVDPRILPASRVWVHGREKLFGTVGALPPHLLSEEDRKHNYDKDALYVDVGLPAEKVRELVRIGDPITFNCKPVAMLNDQFACKTQDDRACVTMLLLAAERLQKLHHDADVWFVGTTTEEVGSRGAMTAAFRIDPDLAIALDVDHATIPGSRTDTTVDLDCLSVTIGPFIQPKLLERLKKCAADHHVKLQYTVSERETWTDTDHINAAREGVPSVLLSLPEKYMHTSVETIDLKVLTEGGRLMAHFISELDEGWEEDLWI
ncbi:MAG: M20/M25/M40 family metallo-hydrolase [Clostridia bacterium]|nr:M20/M25/M40 family metallo-hydrolase [Clostridia bacterium]